MDYWKDVTVHRHLCYADFADVIGASTVWMLSTRGERLHWDARFAAGDLLLFGPESRGLPDDLLRSRPERVLRIPMLAPTRSLNLATSAGIALYEALRQLGWPPAGARPESQ
jgi:tRNA (cytidine/uridine-2'-O-)-methyltransferase